MNCAAVRSDITTAERERERERDVHKNDTLAINGIIDEECCL
jgi:hypothetical protein